MINGTDTYIYILFISLMKLIKLCFGSSADHNVILASQMWCLGRFLPLMMGSHIPRDDEKWGLFLNLLEIVDIVFADAVTLDKAAYLRDLITDHHTSFTQLYPNSSVIPKMHYILHYPRTMVR